MPVYRANGTMVFGLSLTISSEFPKLWLTHCTVGQMDNHVTLLFTLIFSLCC